MLLTLYYIQASPVFPKFKLHPFADMKGLNSYLFSLTERKPKRIFALMKEGEKQKQR